MWCLLADEFGGIHPEGLSQLADRAPLRLRDVAGLEVEDRLNRPEGAQLTEREKVRLRGLLLRSDALGNAVDALEAEATAYPAEYVEVLREEQRRAGEAFALYRAEVGIPGPARKDARRPA